MGIKEYNPTSPGRRFQTTLDTSELTFVRPPRRLLISFKKTGGRNNLGRITSDHRGGGAERIYRVIDFRREKIGVPGVVKSIEYDPNRSSFIALVYYVDGEKRYILAPLGLKVGSPVIAKEDADILPGNALPLKNIPIGTEVHNIEMKPGAGGKLVRAAGTLAQVVGRESKWAHIRMPSGEVRLIDLACWATIGQVGNINHENITIGKAGRSRHFGWRPHVRGTAMNPVDHPHGGGEGRTKGGRHPVTPWGFPTKGKKTRNNPRTDKYRLKDRRL